EEVTTFLEENGYTFPVVYDLTGDVLSDYYINAFPTTFMIETDGTIYGYVSGSLTKEIMINIIEETLQKE
ncbi:MAG: TlpA family protein disulfide reductase, partial [Aminipila sp.]